MTDTKAGVVAHLSAAGYSVGALETPAGPVTIFENDTILGFVLHYSDPATLLQNWHANSTRVFEHARFTLRHADTKAWNAYLVLLADAPGDYGQNIALANIEEDLVGTRKIARAGVGIPDELRHALTPLLPLKAAPRLEAVDMPAEIKLRTPELAPGLVDGFLSNASEAVLLQMLEEI